MRRFIRSTGLFLSILLFSHYAQGSIITVNTLADEDDTGPTTCSLREAISAANTNSAYGGCIAGGASDDISVQVTGTLNLLTPLPNITRGVNINGGGADLFTIAGNNTFRLLNILMTVPSEFVILNGISFTGGRKGAGVNAAAVEFNNNGTLTLSGCDFYNNTGPANGTADGSSVLFSNASAELRILGSTFRNNAVEHVLLLGNTPLEMTNTTISNNTGTGAGIFIFGGMLAGTITNATVTNNNQGIWHANGGGSSTIIIKNSIFAQNSINIRRTGNNDCPGVVNNIASGGYNLFDNTPSGGGGICTLAGTDIVNTNPQLAALANNGGGMWTRNPLLASPVRDAIPADFPFGDARGVLRPLYGAADIGAVEFTAYVNNANDAGSFSLREAISSSPVGAPITFDTAFFSTPRTINLLTPLAINKAIRINGPGANLLTIAGNSTFRLLNLDVTGHRPVQLNDLSFTGGLRTAGANSSVIEINDGDGPLEVNRCELYGNGTVAVPSPVLFTNLAKKVTINGSTFRNNRAGDHTLMIGTTAVDIVNSTVSANTGTGGAVFLFGCNATVNVTSSTITGHNQGIWNACSDGSFPSTVNVKNTLLSQNGNINIRRTGGVPTANVINTLGNNLIDDNSGSQLSNSDPTDRLGSAMNPQLAPLGLYGGGTQTHALKLGSAALNFGTSSGVPVTDQRGSARVIGGAADIGAFERNVTFDQTTLPNARLTLTYPVQLSAMRQTSFTAMKGADPVTLESFAPTSFALVPVAGQGLPPGLTLSPSGLFSGTPTTTGTFTFTVKATDTDGMAGAAQFAIQVLAPPTAAPASISGRVTDGLGRPLARTTVVMTDLSGATRSAVTNAFGYYRFDEVRSGETYIFNVMSKGYRFDNRVVMVGSDLADLDFMAR